MMDKDNRNQRPPEKGVEASTKKNIYQDRDRIRKPSATGSSTVCEEGCTCKDSSSTSTHKDEDEDNSHGSDNEIDCLSISSSGSSQQQTKTRVEEHMIDLCCSADQIIDDPAIYCTATVDTEEASPAERTSKRPKIISNICADTKRNEVDAAAAAAAAAVDSSNQTHLKEIERNQSKEPSSFMLDPSYKCAICSSSLQHIVTVQG